MLRKAFASGWQDGAMRVLVVEDEAELGYAVAAALRGTGIAVDLVDDIPAADDAVAAHPYGCVVFDRMLPAGDSIRYVEKRRRDGWTTPVLFLTARDSVADRVAGFDHGGDDYLVKPFAAAELVARVRSLCRRSSSSVPQPPPITRVGDLTIDVRRRQVRRTGVLLTLTAKEFAVLEVLASAEATVVTRSQLIESCWDSRTEPMSNVVDVVVAGLRRKLGRPALIHTVRGTGYVLEERRAEQD
ncbi:DNA-binding response regulator, OmpR family, contains REC and winged-helix (wHTH) domain [Cryptosporangium aurantiacum]|uniref:DNA-binding response regulator, OmpR family, contains REC and winged-helix (WHTH) domain n=2 Tax=Cryptosporangium aurantiacum TaxID=134849 RepID=A0A1M7RNE8_9ACTN|nr:DNA-binding response regulator, OmpR family, contains REC and winged-helix (wHTH) domain [Cryptosporangium aurantiacum]